MCQGRQRDRSVVAGRERIKGVDCAVRGHLKHGAVVVAASALSDAVKHSISRLNQARSGVLASASTSKGEQGSELAALSDGKNGAPTLIAAQNASEMFQGIAPANNAARVGRTIKVAIRAQDQAGGGIGPIKTIGKRI